jgi:heptosyltransferase-2
VNFYGAGNIGDDVMMAGFLHALGSRREHVKFTCCTPHDIASQRRRFPTIDWRRDTERHRVQAISEANIWLALGDTPFQLHSGTWMRRHLVAQRELAGVRSLPMFYLGVGTEDAAVMQDATFRDLAAGAAQIWCRDEASSQTLRAWTEAPVAVGADLSHIYLRQAAVRWPESGEAGDADLGLILAFEDPKQSSALDAILASIPKDRAIAWLHQEVRLFAGSESDLFNKLSPPQRERLRPAVPNYRARSVAHLIAAWPNCQIVASSRYHGLCIMAWRGARLVAVQRSQKIAGAASDLNIPLIESRLLTQGLGRAQAVERERLVGLAESASAMVDDFCSVVGIGVSASRRSNVHIAQRADQPPRQLAPSRALQARSIAVVKYDSIGDFVLLSPFMRELRRIWPHAHVTLYVRPPVADLARLCPYADDTIVMEETASGLDQGRLAKDRGSPARSYDLVFVPRAARDHFHGLPFAAALDARERWGFAGSGLLNSHQAALTHAIAIPRPQHHARMNLALLEPFSTDLDDSLELWPTTRCVEHWRNRLTAYLARAEKPLCLLGIGAQHRGKMWTPTNYVAIIPEIINTFSLVPVLVGNARESEIADMILSRCKPDTVINLTGFSLEDVCAVARFARLYVGNDTGPKHIAAAARVPVVEINPFPPDAFRESAPAFFHPHGVPYELLQPLPGLGRKAVETGAAIASIRPSDVVAAIERLLERTAPRAGRTSG